MARKRDTEGARMVQRGFKGRKQALVEPMVVEEKIEMFNLLVEMGFKRSRSAFLPPPRTNLTF